MSSEQNPNPQYTEHNDGIADNIVGETGKVKYRNKKGRFGDQ